VEKLLFTSLPSARSRWKPFATGWSLQALALICLFVLSARFRQSVTYPRQYRVTNLVSSKPLVIHERPPVNPPLLARSKSLLEEDEPALAALVVAPAIRRTPERQRPEPEVTAPELKVESKMPVLPTAPSTKIVAVNTFSASSSVIPNVAKPAAAVQTGGFGDVNGIPSSEHGGGTANIAQKGMFDLPTQSGYGNGIGGPNPGVVMSTGFGNGVAAGSPKGDGVVQQSGFEAHYSGPEPHQLTPGGGASVPVEITFKPQPDYTDEGRKRKINGEVRLEVLFSSNGRVHVIRVLQGLGFGLDEQAVKAAEQIKFKPALHAGQPVDSTAIVQIIFELVS
jgi:TonB family protein